MSSLYQKRTAETSVGYLLWQARVKLKISLAEAEKHLKIRQPYLHAIEQDDYANLPGPVYAVGYLRNYALFLGLDPELVSERFLREQENFRQRRKFFIPMPIAQEFGVPHGVIWASLLISLLGYGLWYAFHSHERSILLDVEPLPPRMIASLHGQPMPQEAGPFLGELPKTKALELTITENVWIRVSNAQHQTVLDRFFRPGETLDVPLGRNLLITAGNTKALHKREGGKLRWPEQPADALRHTARYVPVDAL